VIVIVLAEPLARYVLSRETRLGSRVLARPDASRAEKPASLQQKGEIGNLAAASLRFRQRRRIGDLQQQRRDLRKDDVATAERTGDRCQAADLPAEINRQAAGFGESAI